MSLSIWVTKKQCHTLAVSNEGLFLFMYFVQFVCIVICLDHFCVTVGKLFHCSELPFLHLLKQAHQLHGTIVKFYEMMFMKTYFNQLDTVGMWVIITSLASNSQ